ncbi:bifunctional oligoribonuclease/PAP phosphatase NrnA [Methylacidimicrobium sp. B4]|uniref:DHH family phosphoesterase n=1 Tax=Methylacidimicrobium sp. B4 TaxID=2796139 RepID=UPI001A8F90D8|nr:bifunctional oligoribonuclease/PAP phosphatase NrnA [Methylacidimicrobium sp. B4]QSR83856.1 bifunctional oligoribonuclease/PAP phosphatase NrnA [Methylacidimicrobium sp. B4]
MVESLRSLAALFRENHSFAVLSHIRPDGDAIGSSIGLALILKEMGKKVRVFNEEGPSDPYAYLCGSIPVERTPVEPPADSPKVIAVDCSTPERLGERFLRWGVPVDANIDHHPDNPGYAAINCVEASALATAELLARTALELDLPLRADAASALYVGILTDTNSFSFRPLRPETLELAAALIRAGADPETLSWRTFRNFSLNRFALLREILNRTRFAADNRIAFYRLTADLYAETGTTSLEVENFLSYLQLVETVQVAFMVEEISPQITRMSLRSIPAIDIRPVAARFGGGGHRCAAGARAPLPVEEVEQQLLEAIVPHLLPGS